MTGRFAPTASGRMHIGNAYAMLAAWLSARARKQQILLRIEDIDMPRVVKNADQWIMDDLHWLGLDWEGIPEYQSRRGAIYELALKTLENMRLHSDDDHNFMPLVYPCFCSRADIRAASAPQEGDGFSVYPGTCRELISTDAEQSEMRVRNGDRHSLRIAMPTANSGHDNVVFYDRVFGLQRYSLHSQIGDSIVRRSDGLMSYQLVVVVDDLLMGVDDIVRGRDLLRSTALQMWIRDALVSGGFVKAAHEKGYPVAQQALSHDQGHRQELGHEDQGRKDQGHTRYGEATQDLPAISEHAGLGKASPFNPEYAHLPLIDNAAGRRLAKRERSLDLGTLRERGVAPERVIGYCAWLLGLQQEKEPVSMSADDALQVFDWAKVRGRLEDRNVPDNVSDILLK